MQLLNQCPTVFLLAPPLPHVAYRFLPGQEAGRSPREVDDVRAGHDKVSRELRPTSFSVATELKFLWKYTDGETRFSEARDLPD